MTRAWFRAWFRAWLVALRRSSCWWAKCKVNWKRSWIWFPCPGLNALNALPFAASNPGKPAKPTIGSPEVAWKWFDPVGHWIASSITKNMNVKGYQTLLGYMLTMPLFYIVLLWNVTWHVMIMWWSCDEFWIELIHPAAAPMRTILGVCETHPATRSSSSATRCGCGCGLSPQAMSWTSNDFVWFCESVWCIFSMVASSKVRKNREYFSICSSILSYFWLQILRTLYSTELYTLLFILRVWKYERTKSEGYQHAAPSS